MPRNAVRQHERQVKENERHLVGEIVHAVHDEAQAVGLKSGDRFDDEDRGVERGGCGERLAIMGHGDLWFLTIAGRARDWLPPLVPVMVGNSCTTGY